MGHPVGLGLGLGVGLHVGYAMKIHIVQIIIDYMTNTNSFIHSFNRYLCKTCIVRFVLFFFNIRVGLGVGQPVGRGVGLGVGHPVGRGVTVTGFTVGIAVGRATEDQYAENKKIRKQKKQ